MKSIGVKILVSSILVVFFSILLISIPVTLIQYKNSLNNAIESCESKVSNATSRKGSKLFIKANKHTKAEITPSPAIHFDARTCPKTVKLINAKNNNKQAPPIMAVAMATWEFGLFT